MRKAGVSVAIAITSIVLIVAALVVLWLNHPSIMRYRAEYWRQPQDVQAGMTLGGYGGGWFKASYRSISVNIGRAEAWHERQGVPFDIAVYFDGIRVPIEKLNRDEVLRLGGEMTSSYRGHIAYDMWIISSDDNRLRISLLAANGDPLSVILSESAPGRYTHPWRQIQLSSGGKEPFALPVSHSFLVNYFGEPARHESFRDIIRN